MTFEAFLDRFSPLLAHGSLVVFGIAILAGVMASTVCPCTLPVGIGIAGFVGGAESRSKRSGFLIALAFFSGIVVNLTILGALAGRMGAVLTESFGRYWALGMAFVSLIAAVAAFWGPSLSVDRLIALRKPGMAGSFIYGFIFSLGTSAAPLLLLFTLAAAAARPEFGIPLAFAFGIGRGLPFLLVGLFAGALLRFAKLASWRRAIQVLSGSALIFVSVYYVRVFVALL
jgi:cytochrome c-type biogenesis protein